MATASSSLNYRIFHCSSQDPQYPANELLNVSKVYDFQINLGKDPANLRGWQSQRFCVYPQELVLQFPCLVHLKQLQFLIHQNKIPSKIELFSYAPDFGPGNAAGSLVSMSNPNISFVRLGHFSLDDNIKTNYQARELKTVYLEQYCQYLKIVLHKNHHNTYNIFNQVGVVSVTVIGSYMGDYEVAMIASNPSLPIGAQKGFQGDFQQDPSMMPRNLKISSVDDSELDPTLQDKLHTLNAAKAKAVEADDFDKAKILKEVVDKLRIAGQQLIQLELKKKLAIENEDFDSAKVLKYEIDRLRSIAMGLDTDRVVLTPITRGGARQPLAPGEGYQENYEDFRQQQQQQQRQEDEEYLSERDAFEESKDDKGYLPVGERSFKGGDITDRSINRGRQQLAGNEEQVVPALGMRKPIDFNTVNEDDFDGQARAGARGEDETPAADGEMRIQDIPQSQRPIADAMLPLFGEPTTLMVFAKAWQTREQGITEVISQVGSVLAKDEAGHANTCLLQLMTECLKDKVQQITLKSFVLVDAYAKALTSNKNINPKAEISNTEKMLTQLLDKLPDSKFSPKVEAAYLRFFDVEALDGAFLIGFLLKNNSFLNKKLATSFKHQIPRLRIMNSIVTDFKKYESQKKITQQTFPWTLLFGKLREGIEASSQDQRKISQEVITNIYTQFGFKRIEALVSELGVKSLDLLMKDIPEVETYIKMKKQNAGKKD